MMRGTTQETDYPDTGVFHHAGTQCLPHQHRGLLDSGSLADTACHCPSCCRRCYHLPHLETPA